MATLYELTNEFVQLMEMLYDEDVDDQVILDTLEGVSGELEDKADSYAVMAKQLDADIAHIEQEQGRLMTRKQMLKERKKRLLWHLENAMRITGKTKFRTALFSFGIQKNGGKQPLKLDIDPEFLPEEFQIPQPPKPDNEKIRQYIEENGSAPFAHLEPRGESLRIR